MVRIVLGQLKYRFVSVLSRLCKFYIKTESLLIINFLLFFHFSPFFHALAVGHTWTLKQDENMLLSSSKICSQFCWNKLLHGSVASYFHSVFAFNDISCNVSDVMMNRRLILLL